MRNVITPFVFFFMMGFIQPHTSHAQNLVVSDNVTISATAVEDTNPNASGLDLARGMEFKLDGVSIGVDTTAPYSIIWDSTTVANGTYTLSAHMFDLAGNEGSDSENVDVNNADVTPPTVTITITN